MNEKIDKTITALTEIAIDQVPSLKDFGVMTSCHINGEYVLVCD